MLEAVPRRQHNYDYDAYHHEYECYYYSEYCYYHYDYKYYYCVLFTNVNLRTVTNLFKA